MGVHGSIGAGGAGLPSLPAAARLAAMSCCAPAPQCADEAPAEQHQQQRTPVRGGGPTKRERAEHQQAGGGRLEQALHQRCQPGTTLVLPPLLLGIAPPATPVLGGGAAVAVAPDPALTALAALLGNATPADSTTSALRQLGAQLATLLTATTERLRAMLPSLGSGDAVARGSADAPAQPAGRVDAPALVVPMQPPPPAAPTFTLDPALGIIVDLPRPGGEGGTPSLPGSRVTEPDPTLAPSSWVPVPGRLRLNLRGGLGAIAERVGALLEELGITRMQLLLLTIAAPLAVAFGIEVANRILEGR